MNDIANVCEILGADVNMVRKGIGSDSRIGNKFIYPGIGYGGSCFPKDVKALIKTADDVGYPMRILKSVEAVNDDQKSVLFNKLKSYYKNDLDGKTIGLWGLSFKPQTDDMREAPAMVIIKHLLKSNCRVKAYDPVAMEEAKRRIGNTIEYCADPYEVVIDADALLLITEWTEFRFPNWNVIKKLMKKAVIFDGRNIYDVKEIQRHGFDYFGIGIKNGKLIHSTIDNTTNNG